MCPWKLRWIVLCHIVLCAWYKSAHGHTLHTILLCTGSNTESTHRVAFYKWWFSSQYLLFAQSLTLFTTMFALICSTIFTPCVRQYLHPYLHLCSHPCLHPWVLGVVIMHSTQNCNMWGAGYDYTTYSKNFLLTRFISIYYTAIAHSA